MRRVPVSCHHPPHSSPLQERQTSPGRSFSNVKKEKKKKKTSGLSPKIGQEAKATAKKKKELNVNFPDQIDIG